MRFLAVILFFCLLFINCTPTVKIPLHGKADYSICNYDDCSFQMSFPPDSILTRENADNCKIIFYAGKLFAIGDDFSNLWVGTYRKSQIKFNPVKLSDTPIKNVFFDWQRENLIIHWSDTNNNHFQITINPEGKILCE